MAIGLRARTVAILAAATVATTGPLLIGSAQAAPSHSKAQAAHSMTSAGKAWS